MRGRTAGVSVWASMLLLGLFLQGCEKGYRQVVVVDGGKAEFVTVGQAPKRAPKLWVPDRVLVFRTSSPVPGAPAQAVGEAGHVYRINDDLKMEEIDKFDLHIPNDTLAYRYGG